MQHRVAKEIVSNMMEWYKLKDEYGSISVYDAPKQYEEMEELMTEVHSDIKNYFVDIHKNIFFDDLKEAFIKAISYIESNEIDLDSVEINFMTQDEYLDYILQGANEVGVDMFNSLFYWMSDNDRGNYLKREYIDHCNDEFTSGERATFVIRVNEV